MLKTVNSLSYGTVQCSPDTDLSGVKATLCEDQHRGSLSLSSAP